MRFESHTYRWRAVLLCAAISPGLLIAQGPPPEPSRQAEFITKYDRDGDGKLSRDEMKTALPPETGDRVRPGSSNRPFSREGERNPMLILHDREMQALIEEFDQNENGKLDRDEMTALRKATRERSTME